MKYLITERKTTTTTIKREQLLRLGSYAEVKKVGVGRDSLPAGPKPSSPAGRFGTQPLVQFLALALHLI